MSTYQAIGGVSETLKTLLEDRMELPADAVNLFRVSIGPPRPETQVNVDMPEAPRANLFLYRALESGNLKNQEIPGHGNASAYGFPPLSLDLHFLVTAYGTREIQGHYNETLAHFLLGSAMRVLHDFPVIAESLQTVRPPVGTQILHESLRGSFERVKLTFEPVSLEDLAKIYTALTLPFRVAAAYNVSVIQIDSQRPRQFPRRVQPPPPAGPRIYVIPMRRPRIDQLAVRWQGDPPGSERPWPYARIGDTLILHGQNLDGTATRVRIGTLDVAVGITAPTVVEVVVPDAVLPDGTPIPADRQLQPGALTVDAITGIAELPTTGFPSNQAVFMLVPRITALAANLAAVPRTLQVNGTRLFLDTLPGEAVVGRTVISKDLYLIATPTQIEFAVPDTLVGWPVDSLTSGVLAPFPVLPNNAVIQVTIGADGPHDARFPRRPADPADAAALLEAALHAAQGGGPGFTEARVAATTDNRLVIVPGELAQPVSVTADAISAMLELTPATGATSPQVYLSGQLSPFPAMAAPQPSLRLQIGAVTHDITLATRPTSLGEAVPLLEAAIRAFPEVEFAAARVAALDNQILLLPGAAGAVVFGPVPLGDQSSVTELELAAGTLVRVRVNGAESLNQIFVGLTS